MVLPSGLLSGAGGGTSADILISTPVAAIRLPNGALGGLASLGGELTVRATLDRHADGTATLTLDITADGKGVGSVPGGVKVTVPYASGSASTVAFRTDADGTQAVLPKSIALDGQMAVPLDGPSTVVIADNPKSFPDTEHHWAGEYIDFVASHALFQGRDDGSFDPDGTMTRAMLWTVLARMEGADASGGGTWYAAGMEWTKAAGISDGTDPDGSITREQLATMLWRTAGSPEPSATLDGFADAGEAGGYAVDALRWAVEQGILTGKGGGALDPTGTATRGEVAAMLMRFIGKL